MRRREEQGWKAATGFKRFDLSPEERYRLIAEYSTDWVLLELADGSFEYVSPACQTITGYKPADFIENPNLYLEIVHPDDRRRIEAHRCEPGICDAIPIEYRIIRRDGEERWISHLCREVRNREGHFIGCCVSNRDITVRKQSERSLQEHREQLLDLKEQLETKNKELETIIGVVSHDLRTPLVSIHGFSGEIGLNCTEARETLSRMNPSDPQTETLLRIMTQEIPECLNYIEVSVKAMDQLVRSLVKVARAGMVNPVPEPLDMNTLVSDVVNSVLYRVRKNEIQLNVEPLPPCFADREQIAQVFTNLVDNAIKFIPSDRRGSIRIWGRMQEGRSVYCVEDNGMGIAPQSQQKIFDLFARLRFEKNEGEGIGLAMVKRMLDRNNGTIRVESEEDRGSRFFVSLPAADSA